MPDAQEQPRAGGEPPLPHDPPRAWHHGAAWRARLLKPVMAVAAVGTVLSGLAGYWNVYRTVRSGSPTQAAVVPSATQSLALLPLASLGEDKHDEVLADGVSDELLAVLARVPGLRVVSRNSAFSFKGKSVPATEMARQLGVSYLVEGSVRRAGDRVRIAAQLTQGKDGAVLWSETFDRAFTDVLAAQTELALQIAAKLQLPLDRSTLASSGTKSAEAWRLVLDGQRLPRAERESHYRRALVLDPNLVTAHLQLANDAFESAREGVPAQQARDRSVAHLEAALKIDPRSADAYGRLASAESLVNNTEAMRRHTQRALELNPNSVPALHWSAVLALEAGDMEQALSYAGRLAEADPLSPSVHRAYADVLRLAQRPMAALVAAERAQALANSSDPHEGGETKARILADLGRRDEARALAQLIGDPSLSTALGTPEELVALDRRIDLDAHQRAWVELALGRYEAFVAHAQDHAHDLGWRAMALWDPHLDPVRQSPPFVAWLEQCHLTAAHDRAQAWRKAHPPAGR